jgi:hypothetical protein
MPILNESRLRDPLKEATIVALKRVVDPLIDIMLDAGVTVQEFTRVVRERAVRTAAMRIVRESGRSSKSRVAIITGLPRAEVARILSADDDSSNRRPGQHPARKVLSAWYDSPRFLSENGDPAILPIFGRRRSFEQLVAVHSGGIPVRAMLDQLAQINAVEILSGQRVRAKSRVPIFRGLTSNAISIVGERAGDLLETLKSNLRSTKQPLFEGTALMGDVDVSLAPLVHREIAEQGAAFIDAANSLFARSRVNSRRSTPKVSAKCRVGVTVYYFQDEMPRDNHFPILTNRGPRKNLHRQRGQSNRGATIKRTR